MAYPIHSFAKSSKSIISASCNSDVASLMRMPVISHPVTDAPGHARSRRASTKKLDAKLMMIIYVGAGLGAVLMHTKALTALSEPHTDTNV
jgi:hypothetical protein